MNLQRATSVLLPDRNIYGHVLQDILTSFDITLRDLCDSARDFGAARFYVPGERVPELNTHRRIVGRLRAINPEKAERAVRRLTGAHLCGTNNALWQIVDPDNPSQGVLWHFSQGACQRSPVIGDVLYVDSMNLLLERLEWAMIQKDRTEPLTGEKLEIAQRKFRETIGVRRESVLHNYKTNKDFPGLASYDDSLLAQAIAKHFDTISDLEVSDGAVAILAGRISKEFGTTPMVLKRAASELLEETKKSESSRERTHWGNFLFKLCDEYKPNGRKLTYRELAGLLGVKKVEIDNFINKSHHHTTDRATLLRMKEHLAMFLPGLVGDLELSWVKSSIEEPYKEYGVRYEKALQVIREATTTRGIVEDPFPHYLLRLQVANACKLIKLGEELGIPNNTVGTYSRGERTPGTENLLTMLRTQMIRPDLIEGEGAEGLGSRIVASSVTPYLSLYSDLQALLEVQAELAPNGYGTGRPLRSVPSEVRGNRTNLFGARVFESAGRNSEPGRLVAGRTGSASKINVSNSTFKKIGAGRIPLKRLFTQHPNLVGDIANSWYCQEERLRAYVGIDIASQAILEHFKLSDCTVRYVAEVKNQEDKTKKHYGYDLEVLNKQGEVILRVEVKAYKEWRFQMSFSGKEKEGIDKHKEDLIVCVVAYADTPSPTCVFVNEPSVHLNFKKLNLQSEGEASDANDSSKLQSTLYDVSTVPIIRAMEEQGGKTWESGGIIEVFERSKTIAQRFAS